MSSRSSQTPANPAPPHQASGFLGVLPYILDLIVPIAAFYILTALGASTFIALVVGGLLTAAVSAVNTIRRGKLDRLGILVIAEIILGIVLDIAVHDPRLTLARGSLYIGLAGLWILFHTFTERPISVDATKPLAYKGDPNRLVAFEWCAEHSTQFLRIHRTLSTIWCVVFLAYAVLRVVIIYHVNDVSESVWLNEIPGVIGVALCLVASKFAGDRLEKIVDQRVAESAVPSAR